MNRSNVVAPYYIIHMADTEKNRETEKWGDRKTDIQK